MYGVVLLLTSDASCVHGSLLTCSHCPHPRRGKHAHTLESPHAGASQKQTGVDHSSAGCTRSRSAVTHHHVRLQALSWLFVGPCLASWRRCNARLSSTQFVSSTQPYEPRGIGITGLSALPGSGRGPSPRELPPQGKQSSAAGNLTHSVAGRGTGEPARCGDRGPCGHRGVLLLQGPEGA